MSRISRLHSACLARLQGGERPLVLTSALCFLACSLAAGQVPSEKPADRPTDGNQVAAPELGIDELIQAAIEAIDQLDSAERAEERQALLDRLRGYAEQVRAIEPGNPWLRYMRGRINASIGRLGDARDELLRFVETREGQNDWRSHRMLGDLFVDSFPRLAKPHYEKAAALKPNEPEVLKGLSQCMFRLVEYKQALQYARDAVAADRRTHAEYLHHLARMLAVESLWSEAQVEAQNALSLARAAAARQPGRLEAVRAVSDQYRLLIEIAQARIREKPDTADLYVELTRLMREHVKVSVLLAAHERLQTLKLGVRNTEANPSAALLEAYGAALVEVGREAEAIEAFERALGVDPESPPAREWLARLRSPEENSNDE